MPARKLVPWLAVLVAAKLALDHIADADLFWHLRLGLDALSQGALQRAVTYSWSVAGAARLPADWLSQILLALVYRVGGFAGVGVMKALATALLTGMVWVLVRRRAGENLRAAAIAIALFVAVASTQFFARPLLFAALLLAGLILVLDAVADGRGRWALALPTIFALWVNLYGNWPIGFGVLGAAVAAAFVPIRWRRFEEPGWPAPARKWLALGAALSVPALLLNPTGLGLVLRPFWLMRHRAQLSIFDEWAPVPWTSPGAWALLLTAGLLLLACWRSRRALPVYQLALAAALFVMALGAAKQHLVFAIVAAPVLARELAAWIPPQAVLVNRRLNAAVAVLATALLGGQAALRAVRWREDLRAAAPVEAVDALLASPQASARGLGYFDWGGYLLFRQIPTYVDGRLEPFLDSGVFDIYLEVERRGEARWLDAHGVQWLLEKPGTPLARAMAGRPGWHLGYEDARSMLWLRQP